MRTSTAVILSLLALGALRALPAQLAPRFERTAAARASLLGQRSVVDSVARADSSKGGKGEAELRNLPSAIGFVLVGAGVGLIIEEAEVGVNPTGRQNSKAMAVGAVGGFVVWLLLTHTNALYVPFPFPRHAVAVGAAIAPASIGVRVTP